MSSGYEKKASYRNQESQGQHNHNIQPITSQFSDQRQDPHQKYNVGVDENNKFEQDKRDIYKHPLFPLLALMFEKCELSTRSPDCPPSDTVDTDIQTFVNHQQRDNKPFLNDNEEINHLIIKSVQVLRIHLLELEKVQELCNDFCKRYILCLKGKMQSENLLRPECGGYESDENVNSYGHSSDHSQYGAMYYSQH